MSIYSTPELYDHLLVLKVVISDVMHWSYWLDMSVQPAEALGAQDLEHIVFIFSHQ